MQVKKMHLIDRLPAATVSALSPDYVGIHAFTIKRETRMALFQHPNSTVAFSLEPVARASLAFGIGLKQICWRRLPQPVTFTIDVCDSRGRKRKVFEHTLDVSAQEGHRCWLDFKIDLSIFDGQSLMLQFSTAVAAGAPTDHCWAGWSDPVLEYEIKSRSTNFPFIKVAQHKSHQNVLLITADALRADHLACYGHPFIQTPHIDKLANDGLLVVHARAQTPTLLGAYASIATGTNPLTHSILAEWGSIASGITTLPYQLQMHGYHTLMAASEGELSLGPGALPSHFEEQIPCLASPGQSGDVTVRQFGNWLQNRPDKPFFAWIQLFDTHPPATAPAPFRELYYRGDPCDPIRTYDSENVSRVRGVETLLRIQATAESLSLGKIDVDLLQRLRATAQFFLNKSSHGPDLIEILPNLPAGSRRGMAVEEFAVWLEGEVASLESGRVSAALLSWLSEVCEYLREVDAEIVSWLDGVVDFRYAVSQYMSEVSYMDHHVGTIIAHLREAGIYDDTTIVFVSPHGEILNEHGFCFHHHALTENVLRIPLILKPGNAAGIDRGRRVEGVFDQIDIMPTVLESLGIETPASCEGVSRWQAICSGGEIPQHDSIAVDCHGVMFALARPPYVFLRATGHTLTSASWQWNAGDEGLFRMQSPMSYDDNLIDSLQVVASRMRRSLDAWLKRPATEDINQHSPSASCGPGAK